MVEYKKTIFCIKRVITMRHIPNDKYTIAWFKLAECVAKGEKEKAFGVYRLLMHSLDDQAYSYQLEGDLFHAFNDTRYIEKYSHAAQTYFIQNRFKEASLLYSELIFLVPEHDRYVINAVTCYKKYSQSTALEKLLILSTRLYEQQLVPQISIFIDALYENDNDYHLLPWAHHYALMLVKHEKPLEGTMDILKKIILLFSAEYAQQRLALMSEIKHSNSDWYVKLCTIL
jgi:hypothetical protein